MIYPNGTAAPNGTVSIYGLFWQLRGGQCNVRRDFGFQEGQRDPQLQQSIACDLLLEGGNVTKVCAASVRVSRSWVGSAREHANITTCTPAHL